MNRDLASKVARFVLAAAALVWLASPHWCVQLDDFFITVAYAREWHEHGVIRWTSGEIVEGYSNFLWLVVLRLALSLGADLVLFAKLASFAAGAAILGVLSIAAPTDARGHALVAAVTLWAPIAYWSALGFEATTFALLIGGGWALTALGHRGPGLLALAIASLAHPEGLAHLVAAGLLSALRRGRIVRADAFAIAAVALVVAYHAWRVTHFGHVLPTPYVVKIAALRPGWPGLAQLGRELASGVGIAAAIVAVRPPARMLPWMLLPLLVQAALLVRGNGDWMAWGRFLLPGAVAAAFVAAVTARDVELPRWERLVCAVLIVLGAAVGTPREGVTRRPVPGPSAVGAYRAGFDTPAQLDTEWVVENVPEGEAILTGDVGFVGNVDGVVVRDMIGLVDRRVADAAVSGRPFVREEWGDVYGACERCARFIRFVNPDGRDLRQVDAWLGSLYPHAEQVIGPDYRVQWVGAHTERPPHDVVAARWIGLATAFPRQPWIEWRAALARADRGERLGTPRFAHAYPPLADLPASASFTHGPTPLTWVSGRGFVLVRNGALVSRPLGEDDRVLVLDVDDPGPDGAHARIRAGGCDVNVSVHGPQRVPLSEVCAGVGAGDRLTVEFVNDAVGEGVDRNLYAYLAAR